MRGRVRSLLPGPHYQLTEIYVCNENKYKKTATVVQAHYYDDLATAKIPLESRTRRAKGNLLRYKDSYVAIMSSSPASMSSHDSVYVPVHENDSPGP